MALYKADVWLGSNSGRQTVSVSANTITGAKEQIRTIYQVSDTAICNLREAPRERANGGASDDGEASLWGGATLVALLAVAWLVTSFTPQVFGAVGGSATWWFLCRLQGKRFDDLFLPPNRRALLITMALSHDDLRQRPGRNRHWPSSSLAQGHRVDAVMTQADP